MKTKIEKVIVGVNNCNTIAVKINKVDTQIAVLKSETYNVGDLLEVDDSNGLITIKKSNDNKDTDKLEK